MAAKKKLIFSDFKPDLRNANKGTERGRGMLERSLRETGAGRSILTDKAGRVIAGNKTLEAWAELTDENCTIEVVHSDGNRLIIVQRDDLDLSDPKGLARKLAYYDNRTNEVGLDWDAMELLQSINDGLDFNGLFFDHELKALQNIVPDEHDLWQGMPEFKNDNEIYRTIYVHFRTDEDVQAFTELVKQAITEKTKYIWFPEQQRENLKTYKVIDES